MIFCQDWLVLGFAGYRLLIEDLKRLHLFMIVMGIYIYIYLVHVLGSFVNKLPRADNVKT